MSARDRAKVVLEGVTEGPWVADEDGYDKLTVGAGTYLESPGGYMSTDLILENDLVDDPEEPGVDDMQRWADARFIAASRTLVPELITECDSWEDVARARLELIERLKVEKRQLQGEVGRLQKRAPVPEKVTRVVVIKDSGVIAEVFADSWRSFLQDEGRTVKLFGSGSGDKPLADRGAALGRDLVMLTRQMYCNGCGGSFMGHHDCGRKR